MSDEIKEFIQLIIDDFEIEEKLLLELWEKRKKHSTTDYSKHSIAELKQLCKQKGLKVSGTKKELVQRLTECASQPTILQVQEKKPKKRTPPKKKPIILYNLENNEEKIHIRRNTYGYYEHPETGFIFDEKTHKVIGKMNEVLEPEQQSSNAIEPLTAEDIEKCKELRFDYDIPDTL